MNQDAVDRARKLEGLDADPTPAKVLVPESPQTDWSHIPAQQILVVESGGRQIAAVAVDTENGRALYSQETSPCPTCGQDWTRGARLEGQVKILWPDHYKS